MINKLTHIACAFVLLGASTVMAKTPEPKWHSVRKDGEIEIRRYEPMIVAQVTISGERYKAINDGFRILANYIFGGNTAKTSIAMTAPVIQQASDKKGEKIAMTAPVIQERTNIENEWQVRFVMPAGYTLATLPKPNDPHIKFIELPAHDVAMIQFSGFNTQNNLDTHTEALMTWVKAQNITMVSKPSFAFYDPPWTLPFLRRNEVMIRIKK